MDTGCPVHSWQTKGEMRRPLGQEGLDPYPFLEVTVEILLLLQMSNRAILIVVRFYIFSREKMEATH